MFRKEVSQLPQRSKDDVEVPNQVGQVIERTYLRVA
jgi:hypothetical protein